jgi:DNA-binding transcriptional LysR family regulator
MDKLRAIKYFCRAVETSSFTSAARLLGVPQSVLSKTIAALEADLRFIQSLDPAHFVDRSRRGLL